MKDIQIIPHTMSTAFLVVYTEGISSDHSRALGQFFWKECIPSFKVIQISDNEIKNLTSSDLTYKLYQIKNPGKQIEAACSPLKGDRVRYYYSSLVTLIMLQIRLQNKLEALNLSSLPFFPTDFAEHFGIAKSRLMELLNISTTSRLRSTGDNLLKTIDVRQLTNYYLAAARATSSKCAEEFASQKDLYELAIKYYQKAYDQLSDAEDDTPEEDPLESFFDLHKLYIAMQIYREFIHLDKTTAYRLVKYFHELSMSLDIGFLKAAGTLSDEELNTVEACINQTQTRTSDILPVSAEILDIVTMYKELASDHKIPRQENMEKIWDRLPSKIMDEEYTHVLKMAVLMKYFDCSKINARLLNLSILYCLFLNADQQDAVLNMARSISMSNRNNTNSLIKEAIPEPDSAELLPDYLCRILEISSLDSDPQEDDHIAELLLRQFGSVYSPKSRS